MRYFDQDGNERTLWWMIRNEPEWAESQIRSMVTLRAQLAEAQATITTVAHNISGSPATVVEWSEKVGQALLELDRLQQGQFEQKAEVYDKLSVGDALDAVLAKAQALDRLEEMMFTDSMTQVIMHGSFRYARWSQDERSMSYAVSSGPWRQSLASAITEAWERSKP